MTRRDRLDAGRLAAIARARRFIGRRIEVHEETPSTNDQCHAMADDPDRFGTVVFAEHQTAGRGRMGRSWAAPPGASLLFSMLLSPPPSLDAATFLVAWSAAAIADAVGEHSGLDCRIKWPNDLLVEGRKLGGILLERRRAVVVGVGLNVMVRPDEFPQMLHLPATSLLIETGRAIDRTELAAMLLERLDRDYAEAIDAGPDAVWARWSRRALPLEGCEVFVKTRGGAAFGRLISLHPATGARLSLEDGRVVSIAPEELERIEPPTA